ncbi:LysR family transcriptional regulator [Cronobacter sakazakii]|uniref:LysR family transcriptional regulator n=1 Tax=Cronobacter sakazakii TaxID=28141 RepID=UPI000A195382|nr:LysR family transcriptional regulator [Cronobacter sakazakii]PQY38793.1 LysR family transcriptional regulator [Cronobacter sakazakii]PUY89940.1 LysR family transcriptional regulator [Cronobacter sakazakii]
MDRLLSMAVFVSAVEEGSLVSAARRFGLSPSMAGKHVSAIEEQLKVRLLQRSTRKLTLTDVGRSYYTRCKRLLEEYEDANREAQDAQQNVHGILRVAAPTTFGALHLGRVVSNYLAEYPDVSIETTLSDRYVDLLADGIDVAIRIGRLQDSDLVARRLASCRMMFCAAPSFLARHGEPKTIEQLRQAPRLAFSQAVSAGDWSVTDANGQTYHIDGEIRLAANNMQMLLAAALTGAGVVYGPSFVFEQSIASGALRVLLPDHKTKDLAIHAIYPSKRHVSLKVRRFIEHLSMSFDDTQPWDLMHRSTTA